MDLHLHLSVAFRALDRKWGKPIDLDSSEDLTPCLPAVVDLPTTTFSSEEFLRTRRTQKSYLKEEELENVNDTFADISSARIPSVFNESSVEESSGCSYLSSGCTEESSGCSEESNSCPEKSNSCTEGSNSFPDETSGCSDLSSGCTEESSYYPEDSTTYREESSTYVDESTTYRAESTCSVTEFDTDLIRSVEVHFQQCEADCTALLESELEKNTWWDVFRLLKERAKLFISKCKKNSERFKRV